MENVFENMMKKGKNKNKNAAVQSTSGGRPKHADWYGFESIKENGKISAKCLNCKKIFANTAKNRMAAHR